jgi:hypothetical protein
MFSDSTKILSCLLGPGDMLLWDSRTVHSSYPGNVHAEDPQANICSRSGSADLFQNTGRGLIRAASLVSMTPSSRATSEVLDRRRQAVNRSRTLTHWADEAALLGEERGDQAVLEASRVQKIKRLKGPKVLLDCDEQLLSRSV